MGFKEQDVLPKINCTQKKSRNFVNPSADTLSKIGYDFSNKVVQKLRLSKNYFYKKCAPKRVFFNGKEIQKDSNDS